MALIRAKDTKPEKAVRRLVFALGFRYRLHARSLPGNPDMVFSRQRKIILVHGCFWHRHARCPLARLPKSRLEFWEPKLTQNRKRDKKNMAKLKRQGWAVQVIWECEIKDPCALKQKLLTFLRNP
jgi:DNA mismatch endonuclease (patch repair protein)